MVTMTINFFFISRRIILLYYYRNIHLNPNYWYKLLYLYRFMLGFLIVYTTIKDNPMYIYGLLYELNINYFNDLFFDSLHVNMEGYTPGQGFTGNVPGGTNSNGSSGPSGPSGPGGNNPTGVESSNENSRRRSEKHWFEAEGSSRYDYNSYILDHRLIHSGVLPEFFGNKICIYKDAGVEWVYSVNDLIEKDFNYCIVKYPDGTNNYIYHKLTVLNHVNYHRWLQSLDN